MMKATFSLRAREIALLLLLFVACSGELRAAARNSYGLPYPAIHDRDGVNGINFFAANGPANSYSIGEVVAGGCRWEACGLTLSADVSFGDSDDLKMYFRAVDNKGRPYGQINGPGTADDFAIKTKNNYRYFVNFRTGPVSDAKSVFLWAEVRDSTGKVVSRSLSQEMKLVSMRVIVSYGKWVPGQKLMEWIRPVSAMALWNGDRRIVGVRLRLAVHIPPGSPYSRLEKSSGITEEKPQNGEEFRAFTTLQHARWVPGASQQLAVYRVSATIQK